MFTKAVEWGWLDVKPATICRFKENQSRITYLTPEQVERLLESAKQDQNPTIYPFIMIGLETAMRRSEILTIRLEHIDLNRKIIYIPQAKAGAREQPITNYLATYLRSLTHLVQAGSICLQLSVFQDIKHYKWWSVIAIKMERIFKLLWINWNNGIEEVVDSKQNYFAPILRNF